VTLRDRLRRRLTDLVLAAAFPYAICSALLADLAIRAFLFPFEVAEELRRVTASRGGRR
jgi:hypothetical protein